jgi:lipid A 3-O-deacylase
MTTRGRRVIVLLLLTLCNVPLAGRAEDQSNPLSFGSQEIGLTAGYLLPFRLRDHATTKQSGPAFMPSWGVVVTDPIGRSWYEGQIILGAEIVYIQFQQPELTHGVGFTPKIKYLFAGIHSVRPYVEFAGGPFYTDLAGRIPEESSRFNFILTGGVGLSWFLTPRMSLNAGYRFEHISNAGTSYPNVGVNSNLPYGGFSFYF